MSHRHIEVIQGFGPLLDSHPLRHGPRQLGLTAQRSHKRCRVYFAATDLLLVAVAVADLPASSVQSPKYRAHNGFAVRVQPTQSRWAGMAVVMRKSPGCWR